MEVEKATFFKGNTPNKLFDFLSSARPVVVAGAGETPELVMAAGAGKCVAAEDSHGMANSLIEFAEMPVEEQMAMGRNGRNYVLAHYDRDMLSEHFLQILTNVVKRKYL